MVSLPLSNGLLFDKNAPSKCQTANIYRFFKKIDLSSYDYLKDKTI
jgi:hypothetical protein